MRTIHGMATERNEQLKAVPSYGYLHVYRLHPDTTEENLKSYLTSKNIKDTVCTKVTSKHPEEYASFKLAFEITDLDTLQKPNFWPTGTRINRFFHRIPQKQKPT